MLLLKHKSIPLSPALLLSMFPLFLQKSYEHSNKITMVSLFFLPFIFHVSHHFFFTFLLLCEGHWLLRCSLTHQSLTNSSPSTWHTPPQMSAWFTTPSTSSLHSNASLAMKLAPEMQFKIIY